MEVAETKTIRIVLNGEPKRVPEGFHVGRLLEFLAIDPARVAVELNRSIAEPVEVIVNNCVIARGEVVVVEGNFGVRIHEVISRQERLRTFS